MATVSPGYQVARLTVAEVATAQQLFSTMAQVFGEGHEPLSDEYVRDLLVDEHFWALAATSDGEIVGGLTAHTLPMTRSQSQEIFIYDVAVRSEHQRRGVGRLIMSHLTRLADEAGVQVLFVPADDEDAHALEFYRALGGAASPATIFTFEPRY